MKLGEKIKFIRTLRGMTQKELGLKVGFSSATADNRIRQYELGKMKPKEDKLALIAEALDVNIDSLNDIDISASAGNKLFNLLFELERTQGLQVQKIEDKYVLVFDKESPLGDYYNEGLSSWYKARRKFFSTEEALKDLDVIRDYRIWTQQFPLNIRAEEEIISKQIKKLYKSNIEEAIKQFSIKKVSDFIEILVELFLSGINVEIKKNNLFSSRFTCVKIKFSHNELLTLKDERAINAYSRFIAMINYFEKVKQVMHNTTSCFESESYDEYNIVNTVLCTAAITVVKDASEYISLGTFDDIDVKQKYESDLTTFNIPIMDELNVSIEE